MENANDAIAANLTRRCCRCSPRRSSRRCRCRRRRRRAGAAGRQRSTCGSRTRSRSRPGKKIEVIEFFSYGCPHCGEFEPVPAGLAQDACPPTSQFRRVPVMFQDRWVPLAKVYYTLEALGEDARLSPEVFTAIHGKGMSLWRATRRSSTGRRARASTARRSRTCTTRSRSSARSTARKQLAQAVQRPVGADDHRRRQVHRPAPSGCGGARGDAGGRSTRWSRRRAPSGRSPDARSATAPVRGDGRERLHHRRHRRHRRGARAALRRATGATLGLFARREPSSTRSPPRLPPADGRRPTPATCATPPRSRAPPPISSRASARPTSSSPMPASRAAR